MPNSTNPDEIGQADLLTAEDDFSKYLVRRKTEVIYILRSIMDLGDLISASFGCGKHFMLTVIVGIDADRGAVFLDFGSNEALNRKILESENIIFLTVHDQVKVQFTASEIEKATFGGRDAFRIRLPESLIKLQRREYFRVPVPIVNPLKCIVPIKNSHQIEVAIADISIGGICEILPSMGTILEPGMTFHKCWLDLPDIGTIKADMEIMNIFEVTLRNGAKSNRAGCRFIELPLKMESMIQRYISKVEREMLALQQNRK